VDTLGEKKIHLLGIRLCGEGIQLCSFCVLASYYGKRIDIVCGYLWVIGRARARDVREMETNNYPILLVFLSVFTGVATVT